MKRKRKIGKVIALLILTASLCAIAIGGYNLWETQRNYQIGDENYKNLTDLVRPVKPSGKPAEESETEPDGTYNANGSLFIDYNNAWDFSDQLTVIYGHHMKSGQMFGSLKGYKGQAYFENHPYMYLYTDNGNYRIDLLYGCVAGSGHEIQQ